MTANLSVGTKIDHDRYGEGVIGKVNVVSYDVYLRVAEKLKY